MTQNYKVQKINDAGNFAYEICRTKQDAIERAGRIAREIGFSVFVMSADEAEEFIVDSAGSVIAIESDEIDGAKRELTGKPKFAIGEIVITKTDIDGAIVGEIGIVTGYYPVAKEYSVRFLLETTLASDDEIEIATDSDIRKAHQKARWAVEALKAKPRPTRAYMRDLNRADREYARLSEIVRSILTRRLAI